jgi:uncharacterized caspase-like protein
LVIGNSDYERVAPLSNPANDAGLLAEAFRSAGFDKVDLRRDLKLPDMRRALKDFFYQSRDADVAVVFYAGHGIEMDGANYLIPVDAVLDRDIDIYDEALSLDRVLVSVEPAKQLRLVILDACRDNPFARSMKRTVSSRAIGRGLAKVEPTNPNTLIAFAAKAGSTASDGDGNNSPFTTALVRHIIRPGLDLRKAFGYVRDDVLKATDNRQEPYLYGSLGGDDVPLVPAKPAAAVPQVDTQAAIRRDYELTLQLDTRSAWLSFLNAYPTGFYADLAKGQIDKITADEARAAAVERARLAEQEKAAASAKIAEDVHIAAGKANRIEQDKATAREQAVVDAEHGAAQKLSAEKSAADKLAAEGAAKEPAGEKAKDEKLAALSPNERTDQATATDLSRALQAELRRVGCSTAAVDGNWNAATQKALDLFNNHAGLKLDVRTPSADALDAVKRKTGRICPLICDNGYRAYGDKCTKVVCRAGYRTNDNNECEKISARKPVATRDDLKSTRHAEPKQTAAASAKPQGSGQIVCDGSGCRPVRNGCHLELRRPNGTGYSNSEVCH